MTDHTKEDVAQELLGKIQDAAREAKANASAAEEPQQPTGRPRVVQFEATVFRFDRTKRTGKSFKDVIDIFRRTSQRVDVHDDIGQPLSGKTLPESVTVDGCDIKALIHLDLMPHHRVEKLFGIKDDADFGFTLEDIAEQCHANNRKVCQQLGDDSQVAWAEAPEWQRESARKGVAACIADPNITSEALHQKWCETKTADGWTYGEKKDTEAKTHPCLVPYDQLPEGQRAKDRVFRETVQAMLPHLRLDLPVETDQGTEIVPDAVVSNDESLSQDPSTQKQDFTLGGSVTGQG